MFSSAWNVFPSSFLSVLVFLSYCVHIIHLYILFCSHLSIPLFCFTFYSFTYSSSWQFFLLLSHFPSFTFYFTITVSLSSLYLIFSPWFITLPFSNMSVDRENDEWDIIKWIFCCSIASAQVNSFLFLYLWISYGIDLPINTVRDSPELVFTKSLCWNETSIFGPGFILCSLPPTSPQFPATCVFFKLQVQAYALV